MFEKIMILFAKNTFALTASKSSKDNCSVSTLALRYQELTGVIQQLTATKTLQQVNRSAVQSC